MTGSRNDRESRRDEPAQTTGSAEAEEQSRRRSTRRSHRDQTADRNPSGRQFLFIDASADRTTSGEAVRVHVMRESHRNRRERQGSQTQSQSRRSTNQDEMVIFDARNSSRPTSITPPNPTPPPERGDIQAAAAVIDWTTIVQAGVSEASLVSVQELHRLGEGYLRSVRLVQPDVLHMCRDDLLSMCAYLALASLQLASNEQEPANVASVQFEARALELLRRRIAGPTLMHTDATIIAVLILSQLEELKGHAESVVFHLRALQRLIQDLGGLDVLRERNAELCSLLLELGLGRQQELDLSI